MFAELSSDMSIKKTKVVINFNELKMTVVLDLASFDSLNTRFISEQVTTTRFWLGQQITNVMTEMY